MPPDDHERKQTSSKPVERLFAFAIRARILIVGREILARSKSRLHFVLITDDISETSRAEILQEYSHYPIVQHYTMQQLNDFLRVKGTKVVGFQKSDLAKSIYSGLKLYRINK